MSISGNEKIIISNVTKADDTQFNLILCKGELDGYQATVYYQDTKTQTIVPLEEPVEILHKLPDGGVVVAIDAIIVNRVYATVPIALEALKLDYNGLAWEARHKNRKPGK